MSDIDSMHKWEIKVIESLNKYSVIIEKYCVKCGYKYNIKDYVEKENCEELRMDAALK